MRWLVGLVAVLALAGVLAAVLVPRHSSTPTTGKSGYSLLHQPTTMANYAPQDNTAPPPGITVTDALPAGAGLSAVAPNGITTNLTGVAQPRAPPAPDCLKCGGDSTSNGTGRIVPADCLCGGPGGSASLAHISPWLNNDCDSSVGVGSTNVYVWVNMVKTYAGTAQWRYSGYRSCRGYQWIRFNLNMTTVRRSAVAGGFATMMWLTENPLDWTTFSTFFTGGASDGAFSSYAIMAGPLLTTAGIWTSLAQFGPNRNWTSD